MKRSVKQVLEEPIKHLCLNLFYVKAHFPEGKLCLCKTFETINIMKIHKLANAGGHESIIFTEIIHWRGMNDKHLLVL